MARDTVLLLVAAQVGPEAVRRAVEGLRAGGDSVLLGTFGPLDPSLADLPVDEIHDLRAAAAEHGPAFRRALRTREAVDRLLLHVEADEWVARHLPAVGDVVGLGRPAERAAEVLQAQASASGAAAPVPSESRLGGLARKVGLGVSEQERATAASAEGIALLRAGKDAEAERVVRKALGRIRDLRVRADLLGDVVSWSLAHGHASSLAPDAYAAELVMADTLHAEDDHKEAAASFQEAMRTAFHTVLHFEGLHSPLADDPAGFTAPLRDSHVAAFLRGEGIDRPDLRKGLDELGQLGLDELDQREDRRTRLLIATRKNADYLREIREHFTGHPAFDTRFHDFIDDPALEKFARSPLAITEQVLGGGRAMPAALEKGFRPHLEWADVVFVEWCTGLAALISRVDRRRTRVVVRLHSYEAFTQWPHLTDFRGIDDLVFVSEHLRDLVVAAVPGLQGPTAPRLHVITNAMDLQRFVRPKPADARFTLGVVGASKLVKDPRWAIEVLRELRKHDVRYRLHMIRAKFQDSGAGTAKYAEALQADLDELVPSGAVVPLKHTDDVPAVLEPVGVVLSSSVRESFHMGLVEGVASGALPVVRDWPFFPGAARRLFPADWVVGTPAEAAARILALTADERTWRETTAEAAQLVLERWDWSVVSRDFERLLGPMGRGG